MRAPNARFIATIKNKIKGSAQASNRDQSDMPKNKVKALKTLVALGLSEKQACNYLELVDKEWAKVKAKTENRKVPAWVCSCGCVVPKRGAVLAGGPSYGSGYHVHCPECGKVIAVWVDPKETR